MKYFNRSAITAALVITVAAAFSVNAKATELPNIQNSISEMVVAQSQQVLSDLTVQLQQSITEEISNFSMSFSFDESVTESIAWLTEITSKQEGKASEEIQPEAN